MPWPLGSKISPIGLDLGSHSFKAMQVKRGSESYNVRRTLCLPRQVSNVPITREEIVRLHGVLDRRGFAGTDVVVAVPADKLLTAMLELPPRAPGIPIDHIASLEFGRVHKKEFSQLTTSIWELPVSARASKITYMLGVGASTVDLESHIDLLESAGLNVVAIDEPHSAAARGCRPGLDSVEGLIGIIDLGWTAATLTILLKDTIVYTRKLNDSGLKSICQEIADVAATDLATAREEIWRDGLDPSIVLSSEESCTRELLGLRVSQMLKEVGQAFSYASHRYSDSAIAKAIVIGGGGRIPGMAEKFSSLLGTVAVVGSNGVDPSLVPALGLSLWMDGGR